MQTPRISVIVPIYNVEEFLPACVNSLLAQTFSDFELILVDDGSPDGCPALCDRFALQDARIHVIHRANGGLSAARNSGINAARGETIAFVDSDDLVHPEYLEQLYTALMDSGADMAVCGVEDVNEDSTSLPNPEYTLPSQTGTFSAKELLHEFFNHNSTYYTVAWNKLYKRKLWDILRYPEGLIHEDDAVAHLLYWNCSTVVCLNTPLYFYRLRQGSICRNGIRPGSFDGVHAHAEWCRFFRDKGLDDSLLSPALAGCFRRYLSLCFQAKQALTWPIAARWHTTQAELRSLLPLALSCPLLTQKEKISLRRWCTGRLPMPPKTDKKRVGLLLPPGLPVPAVKGGAVEGLATHLVAQNQKLCQLELVIFCEESEEAAKAAAVFSQTMFIYIPKPHSLQVLNHRIFYKAAHPLGSSRYWNFYQHQVSYALKSMELDFAVGEGGFLDSWSEASHILGADKLIAHLHGVTNSNPQLDNIYHSVFAISDYVRKAWLSTSTLSEKAAYLLPNCIDTTQFNSTPAAKNERQTLRASLGFEQQDFVIIFCGRICEDKGIHRLVDAICNISDPRVKLLVVGSPFFANESDSPFFTDLRAKAASLGERIQFTGFLPNDQLPAYYRIADLACFPALWNEPAGITAIEAMACGCPIIATNSGGMPEYLAGSGAILLDRDEIRDTECIKIPGVVPLADQLRQAILDLQADPTRCRQMSLAGIERAKAFSQTGYYTTFVDCLNAL